MRIRPGRRRVATPSAAQSVLEATAGPRVATRARGRQAVFGERPIEWGKWGKSRGRPFLTPPYAILDSSIAKFRKAAGNTHSFEDPHIIPAGTVLPLGVRLYLKFLMADVVPLKRFFEVCQVDIDDCGSVLLFAS